MRRNRKREQPLFCSEHCIFSIPISPDELGDEDALEEAINVCVATREEWYGEIGKDGEDDGDYINGVPYSCPILTGESNPPWEEDYE